MQKSIILSLQDHLGLQRRLSQLLAADSRAQAKWKPLSEELRRAELLPDQLVPAGVIRIGSTFVVRDLDAGDEDRFTLVWPEQADVERGLLSVMAPLGVALIGFSEGDEVAWQMPGGLRRLLIRSVVPPRSEAPRSSLNSQFNQTIPSTQS